MKTLPSLAWLIVMYTVTGLSEAGPPLGLVEAQHIIIHASGYGLLAVLMIYAFPPESWRVVAVLMFLALLVGIGQETLQSIARGRIYAGGSLFDLGVDLGGAAMGIWLGQVFLSRGKPKGESARQGDR